MIRRYLFLICLLISAPLQAGDDKAFFWKVESDRSTVYLMGSLHYADKSFYPLRSDIRNSYEHSDMLVVELQMDAEGLSVYRKLLEGEGSYSGKETIKDHVSDETYIALEQRLKQLGISIELVKKQKPGMLVLTLAAAYAQYLGLDPALGIDQYFLSRAEGKGIVELESVEQQLRIFLEIPNGDLMLKESLYTMQDAKELITELIGAWKAGDEKKLHQLLFDDALAEYPEFASIYDRLFYQRNIKMATAIKSYLASEQTYFVVIGAGHFLGEKGIVRLLEQSGYEVKRI